MEGSTENATLVTKLLGDLVDRGLDPEQAVLFVIDGGKALRRGSRTSSANTRWCIVATVTRSEMSAICCLNATGRSCRPRSVARGRWKIASWPCGVWRHWRQSLIAAGPTRVRRCARGCRDADADGAGDHRAAGEVAVLDQSDRVDDRDRAPHAGAECGSRWKEGDMRKRWTSAGMLVAEAQFRRVVGYSDLAKLVIAIERHALVVAQKNPDRAEVAELVSV